MSIVPHHPLIAAALVTCMLPLVSAAVPSFPEHVQEVIAPPYDSSGPVRDIVRWGGRVFVQTETRTWWSGDKGLTWNHKDWFQDGPKGSVPSLDKAWFTRAATGLWLGNRNGSLAWGFDSLSGSWRECAFGHGTVAAAGSGDRLYSLAGGNSLRVSRNAGVTWSDVPMPDSVRKGSFYDDVQADGDRVLLRVRDLSNSQAPAFTLDGGRTWARLPARSATALAHGCAYAAHGAQLLTACPDTVRVRAPFVSSEALFTEPGGLVFAWADSALYFRADGTWGLLASAAELRSWERTRDVLFSVRMGTLAWFTGAESASGLRRPRGLSGSPAFKHAVFRYMFRGEGRDLLGRGAQIW